VQAAGSILSPKSFTFHSADISHEGAIKRDATAQGALSATQASLFSSL